jgi:hypothetical protein
VLKGVLNVYYDDREQLNKETGLKGSVHGHHLRSPPVEDNARDVHPQSSQVMPAAVKEDNESDQSTTSTYMTQSKQQEVHVTEDEVNEKHEAEGEEADDLPFGYKASVSLRAGAKPGDFLSLPSPRPGSGSGSGSGSEIKFQVPPHSKPGDVIEVFVPYSTGHTCTALYPLPELVKLTHGAAGEEECE